MTRLAGRVAVLTGAARGIGGAIARRFVAEGARIVIGDVQEDEGKHLAEQLGGPGVARFLRTDISREADAEEIVAETLAAFGKLDILIQNAGIYPLTPIEHISTDEWDAVLGVNLRGTFLAAKAAMRPMRAAGYGRMVFTSSITGPRVTSLGHGHYGASKAGINGFIRSAALEFAPYGITVNGVEPGNILTEGMQEGRSTAFIDGMAASVPLGRLGTPREVADAVLFLASEESSFVTGTTLIVDGGQTLPEGPLPAGKPELSIQA